MLVFAQTERSISNLQVVVIILLMIVTVLIIAVALYAIYLLRRLFLFEKKRIADAKGADLKPIGSFWQNISRSLTSSTMVVEEEPILMNHEYDGIRELNNHLPRWWKALFYFTITCGAIYLLVYHVFNLLPLSREEFNREVAQTEEAQKVKQTLLPESIDETTVEFTDDPGILANGEDIFKSKCAVCHASDGGGGIGPNLTDEYWLHGGSIKNIFWVIKHGVPTKGMISWQSQLTSAATRDVASYIYTLKRTTPANPKEPQGELYNEETPVLNLDKQVSEDNIKLNINSVRDTMDYIRIGRKLFSGSLLFTGGGPGCIMCHQVTDDILAEGGLIAPELTNVYSRFDEKTIIARVTNPYHPTMQEAYKGKQVTVEEASMLVLFFKQAATESTYQLKRDKRAAGFLNRVKRNNQE